MVTQSDVQAWMEGLKGFWARIAPWFGRAKPMACPLAQANTAHLVKSRL
jgi:hypothetical protein